jgi:hypothetical protein
MAAGGFFETDSDDLQHEIIQATFEGQAFHFACDPAQSLFSDGTEKKELMSTGPASCPTRFQMAPCHPKKCSRHP